MNGNVANRRSTRTGPTRRSESIAARGRYSANSADARFRSTSVMLLAERGVTGGVEADHRHNRWFRAAFLPDLTSAIRTRRRSEAPPPRRLGISERFVHYLSRTFGDGLRGADTQPRFQVLSELLALEAVRLIPAPWLRCRQWLWNCRIDFGEWPGFSNSPPACQRVRIIWRLTDTSS